MREKVLPIGIIGAGPAGISAAVQLRRSDFPVTLFEGGQPGGLIRNAWRVENLSVCPVIPGRLVADQLAERLFQSEADIINADVTRVEYNHERNHFAISCPLGEYRVRTLLVASGTRPKPWSLSDAADPVLKRCFHRHVAGLDVCSGVWAVVGSGDAAFDYALSLNERGVSVFLLLRGERARALPLLQREVLSRKSSITCLTNATCIKVCRGRRRPVRLMIEVEKNLERLELDGIVGAIGRIPSTEFLSGVEVEKRAELNRAGRFYMIGDVNGSRLRQSGIAIGEGLHAAMLIAG